MDWYRVADWEKVKEWLKSEDQRVDKGHPTQWRQPVIHYYYHIIKSTLFIFYYPHGLRVTQHECPHATR
jgi:hypothetical protein